jgi:tRNA(fMet)-specific endonuclease VapC
VPAIYLLDTNIVSYLLSGNPRPVRQHIEEVGLAATAISTITEAELRYGLAIKPAAVRQRIAVETYLADAAVFPWDSAAARAYSYVRADLKKRGKPLDAEDLMIASHALSLGLTLVTHDQAFSFIDGLRVQDWTVP